MSFLKDKPYWLRMGVVGFLIGLLVPVLLLLGYIWDAFEMRGFFWSAFGMIGLIIGIGSWGPLGSIIVFCQNCSFDTVAGIGLWITPLTYFLYGAVIGFIIDRIKPREREIR